MSVLGPIMDASLPEQSLVNHLKDYLPIFLAAVDEERGFTPGFTSPPKAWEIVSQLDFSSEPQYPSIFIVSPGAAEPPKREGNGTIRMTWEMNVAATVQGPDQAATEKLAKRYAAAILGAIMAKRSLGDPNVRGTDYMGDSYDDLPMGEKRTKQIAFLRFQIEYDHVARSLMVNIPNDPPDDPTTPLPDYPTLPDIDHVFVDVVEKEDQ